MAAADGVASGALFASYAEPGAEQLAGDLRRNGRTGLRDLDLSDEGRHGAVPPTGTDRASRPAGAHSATRPCRISSGSTVSPAGRVAELGPVPYHPAATGRAFMYLFVPTRVATLRAPTVRS